MRDKYLEGHPKLRLTLLRTLRRALLALRNSNGTRRRQHAQESCARPLRKAQPRSRSSLEQPASNA